MSAPRRSYTDKEDQTLLENYVKCGGQAKALCKLLENRKQASVSQHMKQKGFIVALQEKGI